jgi:hypothetical protein
VFFRNEQKESVAFWLTRQCLETDEEHEQKDRHMTNAEFVAAVVGVVFVIAAVRLLVWLFCGC